MCVWLHILPFVTSVMYVMLPKAPVDRVASAALLLLSLVTEEKRSEATDVEESGKHALWDLYSHFKMFPLHLVKINRKEFPFYRSLLF